MVEQAQKRPWTKPELCYDGLLQDLVQTGLGKTITGSGDGVDPFEPPKGEK